MPGVSVEIRSGEGVCGWVVNGETSVSLDVRTFSDVDGSLVGAVGMAVDSVTTVTVGTGTGTGTAMVT